jgi:hypothetical protein
VGILTKGVKREMMPPLPSRNPWSQPNPDLQTQLEELLSAVWEAEDEWRLDDRIDLALRIRRHGQKAA